mmetsp:Transcript_12271/g.15520  ORF Transcript_12271/g.15520 Transcript_12271/m.15520 type:complete len:119 (+) Transcript_12271:257-613(+)
MSVLQVSWVLKYSTEDYNITMACYKGHIHHECKEGRCNSKKVHFQCESKYKAKSRGLSSKDKKDLNTFAGAKITKALGCHEKKEKDTVNKFKVFSISSRSNCENSDSESKVSCTSGEE